jgi:uncharacterized protein YceH (UPF0502 family)
VDGDFDPTERRVVGVLVEKALSTPDYYPMTVNAIVSACNQKNNRDPVTTYAEFQVEGALRALFEKKWVGYVEGSGRVRKWKHMLDERLGLSPTELAVLAELLLRGAQQPGELRTRAGRMANIPTPESLMEIIDGLGRRLPPLVVKLPRLPGARADRYGQTLAPDDGNAAPTTPPSPPSSAAGAPSPAAAASLAERVERLEREVAELRSHVDAFKGRGA